MTEVNPREIFLKLVSEERPSPVLEIGTHQSIPGRSVHRYSWFPYLDRKDYITSDVFAGADVDEVSDIHALPDAWENRFGAFLAGSVFEHLERPWIAAQQIGKVLRPGGLCYVVTHQCFPIHGFPSDYFRFSDQALSLIFKDAGFEIVAAGYENRCSIVPPAELVPPSIQAMWNSNHPSYIHVHVTARMVKRSADATLIEDLS